MRNHFAFPLQALKFNLGRYRLLEVSFTYNLGGSSHKVEFFDKTRQMYIIFSFYFYCILFDIIKSSDIYNLLRSRLVFLKTFWMSCTSCNMQITSRLFRVNFIDFFNKCNLKEFIKHIGELKNLQFLKREQNGIKTIILILLFGTCSL